MSEYRTCQNCGKGFTANRSDHFFCSAACVAAYYRNHPNPEFIHAEKEHTHTYYCEHCGVPFKVNGYADRGGKRTPKYCSPKCKQAAYRERMKGEPQAQAKRRYDTNSQNTGGNGRKSDDGANTRQQSSKSRNERSGANSGHTTSGSDFWKGYKNRTEAAYSILGVSASDSKKAVRDAWIRLVNQFHPDHNSALDATLQTQKINWAYQYLSK